MRGMTSSLVAVVVLVVLAGCASEEAGPIEETSTEESSSADTTERTAERTTERTAEESEPSEAREVELDAEDVAPIQQAQVPVPEPVPEPIPEPIPEPVPAQQAQVPVPEPVVQDCPGGGFASQMSKDQAVVSGSPYAHCPVIPSTPGVPNYIAPENREAYKQAQK